MWDLLRPGILCLLHCRQSLDHWASREAQQTDSLSLSLHCHVLPSGWRHILPWAAGSFGSQLNALSGIATCRRKFLAQGFIPSTIAAQWLVSTVVQRPGPLPRFRTTLKAILSSKTLCRSSWPTYLPWLIPHQDSTSPFNQLYFPYPPTGVLAKNICQ